MLHGFCVAVLGNLIERSEPQVDSKATRKSGPPQQQPQQQQQPSKPLSPRYDWSRASCPAITKFSNDDTFLHQPGRGKKESASSKPPDDGESIEQSLLAPVCYCFTSKFPFYRFHYTVSDNTSAS